MIGAMALPPSNAAAIVPAFRNMFGGQPGQPDFGTTTNLDQTLFLKFGATVRGLIANRPGIRPEALRLVIPPDLIARPDARKEAEQPSQVVEHLHKTTIYLLEYVSSGVSATDVRRHAHRGQSIHGLVSSRVEEYILKQGLYR